MVGVDPRGSIFTADTEADVTTYLIEGVGEDFWPETFDPSVVDRYEMVADAEAPRFEGHQPGRDSVQGSSPMSHEKAIFDGVRTRLGVRKSREMTLRIHRLEEGADRGRRAVQRSDQERCHLGASDGIARTVQGPVQSATQGDGGSSSAWHPNRPLPPQRRMQMATDDDFPGRRLASAKAREESRHNDGD